MKLLSHMKYFTIDFLNERINKFGFSENKPRPIDPYVIRTLNTLRLGSLHHK